MKCKYCKKQIEKNYEQYEICASCYSFIMNEFKPEGLLKQIFSVLPCNDGFHSWGDVAQMRLDIKNIIDKLK